MVDNWNKLQLIDRPHVASENLEFWGKEQYLYELEDKWSLSYYVHLDNKILGYRIVSGRGKIQKHSHSHRTSIMVNYQNCGIGTRLLNQSVNSSKELGYVGMTGMRKISNEVSKRFLIQKGWIKKYVLINKNELWSLKFE